MPADKQPQKPQAEVDARQRAAPDTTTAAPDITEREVRAPYRREEPDDMRRAHAPHPAEKYGATEAVARGNRCPKCDTACMKIEPQVSFCSSCLVHYGA